MINYPNGKHATTETEPKVPGKSPKVKKIAGNEANRGMDFEHAVNLSCEFYDTQKRAIITKRPTPIKIVKTDYKLGKITEAYFEKQSNTDYNGVYRGKYVDFECKETHSTSSLSFNNIPLHQVKHLKKVLYHGGIAFFLVYFKMRNEVYLIDAAVLVDLYENGPKKSISYSECQEKGILIEEGFAPRLDFLNAVDKIYFHE